MKNYVTLDKRSKKAQKAYYSSMRLTWEGMNPATRTMKDGKTYDRNREKQKRHRIGREFNDGFDADFYLMKLHKFIAIKGTSV